jgi:hypothetical protein
MITVHTKMVPSTISKRKKSVAWKSQIKNTFYLQQNENIQQFRSYPKIYGKYSTYTTPLPDYLPFANNIGIVLV